MWAREPQLVDMINTTRENSKYLKGFQLPANITATNDMSEV